MPFDIQVAGKAHNTLTPKLKHWHTDYFGFTTINSRPTNLLSLLVKKLRVEQQCTPLSVMKCAAKTKNRKGNEGKSISKNLWLIYST